MAESTVWWLLAGAAVAVEVATGTFYLLMLSIGLAAGAIAAHAGAGLTGQLVAAALVGGGAAAGWHFKRRRNPPAVPMAANPDVNTDIGESVHVDAWTAERTASVHYRGANWTVVAAPGTECVPGAYRVSSVAGNRLIVEKT